MIKYNKVIFITLAILILAALSACNSEETGEIVSLEDYSKKELNNESFDLYSIEEDARSAITSVSDEDNSSLPQSGSDKEESIYVYVCGCVLYPDVYELDYGARVVDAINAAGGTTSDSGEVYLNLASSLKDGEKVYVPTKEEVMELLDTEGKAMTAKLSAYSINSNENTSESSVKSSGAGGKINLNTADSTTLQNIPGVGEAKANKIISYRDENGGFSKIEDIMNISGIKEGMFNKIKDYICVE